MARAKNFSEEDEYNEVDHQKPGQNPVWFKPLMFGFLLVGFLWILTYYIFGTDYPIPGLGSANLIIGFGILLVGLLLTTRWR